MRRAASLIAGLVAVSAASGQPVQSLARVKVGSCTVRSGPGDQMPACGSLEQGTAVVVDHPEGNDWLAIQPPKGSLSWINHLHVELQTPADVASAGLKFPLNAVVNTEGEVKLATGAMGEAKPLNVRRTKLPQGTIVKVVGPKVQATAEGDGGASMWYPIVPPNDDFRYVRKADVELVGGTATPGFVVKTEKVNDPALQPAAFVPGVKPSGDAGDNPLWRDAEKARMDGNYPLAERLYKQLAEEATKGNDTALANLCFNRIHYIRELQRQKDRGGDPVVKPLVVDPPAVAQKPAAQTGVGGNGLVRAVDFTYQNKKVFALTDRRGVNLYLVSDDLDLARYVGKWVELNGTVSFPKEFGGTGLMVATAVEKVESR